MLKLSEIVLHQKHKAGNECKRRLDLQSAMLSDKDLSKFNINLKQKNGCYSTAM